MVKKRSTKNSASASKARIGIVIYTPEGILIPSASTVEKMKKSGKIK